MNFFWADSENLSVNNMQMKNILPKLYWKSAA